MTICKSQPSLPPPYERKIVEGLLAISKEYNPLWTQTEDRLKVEFNLIDGKIDTELDKRITEQVEKSGDWKWYAQGVNLETKRRDIAFERKRLAPVEG